MELKGTKDPFIVATMRPPAAELWNSPSGQSLVERTHPKQHRLLASMFENWIRLIEIRERMAKEEEEHGSSLTTVMTGSDGYELLVEHTLMKLQAKIEKRVREAEVKLGLTLKDLAESPPEETDDVPDFGG